ncbi:hypothetical protein LTR66_013718 [Elasticomyces elasticus]|nr:hypothetical protein LTR66_013718 [Elasticomyces elasticus]KAK4962097.1 hypothetical protein LTR28_004819 [Elasticomyces elasticus]
MPTLRNLTVNVTDAHHRPLPEWGVQHFGGAGLSTCYVQSETDQTFCVTVEARIPFEGFDGGGDAQLKEDPDGGDRVSQVKRCERETETENLAVRVPPYHMAATLYLDGRKQPEKCMVVDLGPNHNDNKSRVVFTHRRQEGADGTLRKCTWYFRDVGVETLLDKLLINQDDDESQSFVRRDGEDASETTRARLEDGLENKEEVVKLGQIEIVCERVTFGHKHLDTNFEAAHSEDKIEIDIDAASRVSHTAGINNGRPGSRKVKVATCHPYDPKEPPYATFRFYYRSAERLQKLNFPGFAQPVAPISRMKRLDKFLDMTPPSMGQGSMDEDETRPGTGEETDISKGKRENVEDSRVPAAGRNTSSSSRPREQPALSVSSGSEYDADSSPDTSSGSSRSAKGEKKKKMLYRRYKRRKDPIVQRATPDPESEPLASSRSSKTTRTFRLRRTVDNNHGSDADDEADASSNEEPCLSSSSRTPSNGSKDVDDRAAGDDLGLWTLLDNMALGKRVRDEEEDAAVETTESDLPATCLDANSAHAGESSTAEKADDEGGGRRKKARLV